MGSYLKFDKDFPDKLVRIGKTIEDIVAADQQVDTDIHMVSDSIDIMVDTSDSLSEYTIFLKDRISKLKELAGSDNEEMIETVDEICEIIEECNSLLFGFVEMSHEIQNVVRSIANDVDEITEATGEVSEAFGELVHNSSQALEVEE